jgi:hypothetical protein
MCTGIVVLVIVVTLFLERRCVSYMDYKATNGTLQDGYEW